MSSYPHMLAKPVDTVPKDTVPVYDDYIYDTVLYEDNIYDTAYNRQIAHIASNDLRKQIIL